MKARSFAAAALCILLAAQAPAQGASAVDSYRQGLLRQASTDWYGAIELFLDALSRNPAYADPMLALSKCYYEIGEYSQALSWARKASALRSGSAETANQEAVVLVATGDHDAAAAIFREVLQREPNNLEARFGLALIDLADGRSALAVQRYEEALRIAPLNARALLSLALIHSRTGKAAASRAALEQALRAHASDPQVRYYAAYLAASDGSTEEAALHCRTALSLDPRYADARRLLGAVCLARGEAREAEALMREALSQGDRSTAVWNVLAAARSALGMREEALSAYRSALAAAPDDEITRVLLERLLLMAWKPEDAVRESWAEYHFKRGRELEGKSYRDQAAFEYRRGLKLYPYSARGRREYAELLRTQGFAASYLEELRLLREDGQSDQPILDAIETYESLLVDSVASSWGVDQFSMRRPDVRLSLFCLPKGVQLTHPGSAPAILSYLGDILAWTAGLEIAVNDQPVSGFAEAFRKARESRADYFLILDGVDDGQDMSLKAVVHSGRTGAEAGVFQAFRSGNDRLRQSASRIAGLLVSSLPRRFILERRKQALGLATLGRADGVKVGDEFVVVRKGASSFGGEGFRLEWPASEEVGSFTVTRVDEELSEGLLQKKGFFDRINAGDEIVRKGAKPTDQAAETRGDGLYQEVRPIR